MAGEYSIGINDKAGVIVKGERITIQQESWDGKEIKSIFLSIKDIIELAEKLKDRMEIE